MEMIKVPTIENFLQQVNKPKFLFLGGLCCSLTIGQKITRLLSDFKQGQVVLLF